METHFVVIVDNVRSTHNVGSFFRTADGAGVNKIFLCGITPVPPRKDIDKVSLGAEKALPFEFHTNTIEVVQRLKHEGYAIVALENNVHGAVPYHTFIPRFPLALIVGAEVEGIHPEVLSLADAAIMIPMHGSKTTLNVSVAFGIVAYALINR